MYYSEKEIERLCKYAVWLDKGKVKMIGDSADVYAAYSHALISSKG